MKIIYKTGLQISKGALLSLICLFALSCTDDNYSPVINGTDTADVQLTIYTPGTSLPKDTKRSTIAAENNIERVKILVFKPGNSYYEYQYMVDGESINQDASSNTATFTAKLVSSAEPMKLLLITNYKDAFDNYEPADGAAETTVRRELIDNFAGDAPEELPMFGEVSLDYLQADHQNTISTTMLRAVARVDVKNTINTEFSEDFALRSVHIFRANDKVRLIPDPSVMSSDGNLSVRAATVPDNAGDVPSYSLRYDTEVSSIEGLYLSESLPLAESENYVTSPTCVVVGGVYGDDDFVSYYRIDFDSGIEGHPFGQVLRNYKYVFNILQVNERGWQTPEDAANNESTAIIAVMQIWNEMTFEMYFSDNDNYLGISSRKVVLEYTEGAEKTVYLQTTVPFNIQALDENGNPTGPVISSVGETLNNGFYDMEIVKTTEDEETIYRLLLTSTGENRTDAPFTGQFIVTTDYWRFDVTVEQETYLDLYKTTIVNVLTITSLPGDLGNSDGIFTDGVSGDAMRNVIENPANFSVNGTVPIKAIIVHDFSNQMISSSDASSMYILEKMLSHVDVVHLPKDCTPSVAASQLIHNWVTEKYHRVLILGTDNADTNANLISYFDGGYYDDGDWKEGSGYIAGLFCEQEDERGEPFFNGIFGTVNSGSEMGFVPGGCGYNNGYNYDSTVVLLRATRDGSDSAGMMTHGINTDLGIFYCGESRVTTAQGEAMSQQALTNGTVTSEFDILMANVWVWIVDRVVAGDHED